MYVLFSFRFPLINLLPIRSLSSTVRVVELSQSQNEITVSLPLPFSDPRVFPHFVSCFSFLVLVTFS